MTLAQEEARHLRDVLRLRAGEEVFVFDGEGREFACVVAELGAGKHCYARLEVRAPVEAARPESPLRLTLALALLKGEKFDLVVQKATELGVARVVPVATLRADVRARDAKDEGKRAARWRRLALEAAKQSGRARVPVVEPPRALADALREEAAPPGAHAERLPLFFTERGGRGLMSAVGGLFGAVPPRVAAMVGPEGGWDDSEIEAARHADWQLVTLGGRTLRAETAAVAAVVLLQHLFGDLG